MPVWSQEDRLIADSADALFADTGGLTGLRLGNGRTLARIRAEGWAGVLLDEEQGGLGFGLRGAAIVMQSAGRNLSPEPLAAMIAVAWLLGTIGEGTLVSELMSGQQIILSAHAQWDGERYVTGAIPGIAVADHLVVFCSDDQSLRLINCKNAKDPEVDIDIFSTVDFGSSGAASFAKGAGTILCVGKIATELAEKIEDLVRLFHAAELVGIAAQALTIVSDYVKIRQQFGVSLSSHQVIQHRLASVHVQIAAAEAIVYEAVRAVDGEQRRFGVKTAYQQARHAAELSTREAIQFHGGMGFTDECDIGLFFKRVMGIAAAQNGCLPVIEERVA